MEEEGWKLAALKLPESDNTSDLRLSLTSLTSKTSALSPTFAGSGLDKLMLTTQQAKLKQLKKIQLLKSQVHQSASLVAQRQEKEEHEQLRANEAEARIQQLKAERIAREADVEARRREIAAEAERRTEALKQHLITKVGSSEQKAEMILRQRAQEAEEARERKQEEVRVRQEALLRNSLVLSEERQAKLAQKEAAAEAARQRIADQKARAEADSRTRALQAETERLQALEAAEQEYQARYEYYQAKVDAKEHLLSKKKEQQAAVRAAQVDEARLREEYAKRRLELKLRRDETLRQELSRKVEFKNERMAAIEEQRRSLMEELEDTRKEIAAHDNLLKEKAAKMKYDGKVELSPEIEALEQKYAREMESLRLLGTPGRTPTQYGSLSHRSWAAPGIAGRRASPLTKSVPEFPIRYLNPDLSAQR